MSAVLQYRNFYGSNLPFAIPTGKHLRAENLIGRRADRPICRVIPS